MTKTATLEMIEAGFHASRMGSRECVEKVINAAIAAMPGEAVLTTPAAAPSHAEPEGWLAPSPQPNFVLTDEAVWRAARAIWQTWRKHKGSEASWEDAEAAVQRPHDLPLLYEARALALEEARAALMAGLSTLARTSGRAERIAAAIEACDWSGSSIGNKEILKAAVAELRSLPETPPPADKAEIERLREALAHLERAGTDVSNAGATPGSHFPRLTSALIRARAALKGGDA